jgi:predicted transcriptional regulator
MDEQKLLLTVVLLLINTSEEYSSAYKLTLTLARRFGVFKFIELMDGMVKEGLVSRDLKKQIEHYQITENGYTFLNENKAALMPAIKQHFPDQYDFINALVKNP